MSVKSFSVETAAAVAEAVRPWLTEDVGSPPPVDALLAALRAAEAATGGRERDLWGHAAGNVAVAAAAPDDLSCRWLWATALDYAQRAGARAQDSAVPRTSGSVPAVMPAGG
jgi:hypothetical protein